MTSMNMTLAAVVLAVVLAKKKKKKLKRGFCQTCNELNDGKATEMVD